MTLINRILFVLTASFAWWAVAACVVFVALFPCGMGPDATCADGGWFGAVVTLTAALIGYLFLGFHLFRRWSR